MSVRTCRSPVAYATPRLWDGIVLVVPVLAMVIVATLPEADRIALGFAYTAPTLTTAYTNHFVHIELDHLIGNLIAYGVLASTFYWLCVLAGRRGFWLAWTGAYFVAFPPTLAALNLTVERTAVGVGFSAMNTALLGALPVAMTKKLEQADVIELAHAPAIGAIPLWIVVALGIPRTRTAAVGVGLLGVLTLLYWRAVLRARPWAPLRVAVRTPGVGEGLLVAAVVLVGYAVVVFPQVTAGDGPEINYLLHLLGYCLGFLVAFVAVIVFDRLAKREY